jgi:hypothetical protein
MALDLAHLKARYIVRVAKGIKPGCLSPHAHTLLMS